MATLSRSTQRRVGDSLFARFVGPVFDNGADPVLLGRVLVVVAAIIVACAVPLLDTDDDAWLQVALATSVLLAGLAVSFVIPWQRISRLATMLFPLLVCTALVSLSAGDAAIFSPLTGLLSLCFAYIGLTQRPRTAFAVLPVAAATFVYVNGEWTSPIIIRLIIGCAVWAILGEALARFTVRQDALSEALRVAAHTDALTGVANRRDLELHLATVGTGDTIVICDLDHFKALNDSRGHHAGDLVLADFGSMLRATLRSLDFSARYGGEEFVLVLPATSHADAEATLTRMRAHWAVLQPSVTFSAGFATCRDDRSHAQTLAVADSALYAAKAAGRDCSISETVLADQSVVERTPQA